MDGTHSVPQLSTGGSPPIASSWEQWEERLFTLTDQIEGEEGVPVEYAYHLAQMRLGMICEAPEIPSCDEPDISYLLPY